MLFFSYKLTIEQSKFVAINEAHSFSQLVNMI
jgi:hypothetical protein